MEARRPYGDPRAGRIASARFSSFTVKETAVGSSEEGVPSSSENTEPAETTTANTNSLQMLLGIIDLIAGADGC